MNDYKITLIPGFQQGHKIKEFMISDYCVKKLTDASKKIPVEGFSKCNDRLKVSKLKCRLDQIDWSKLQNSSDEIFVDDVNLYIFEGGFGKVSIPLEYVIDNSINFGESLFNQCKTLYEIFQDLDRFKFET
ncbi:MAG: hypothetical protein ACSHX0_13475 [Akkermansiaceae bacterium]